MVNLSLSLFNYLLFYIIPIYKTSLVPQHPYILGPRSKYGHPNGIERYSSVLIQLSP